MPGSDGGAPGDVGFTISSSCTADRWCAATPARAGLKLEGIGGTAPNDVWLVGRDGATLGGAILHYGGSSGAASFFGALPPGDLTDFAAVWAFARDNVYAVGETRSTSAGTGQGVVHHFDGASWSPAVPSATTARSRIGTAARGRCRRAA